jgi:hypothetical protein
MLNATDASKYYNAEQESNKKARGGAGFSGGYCKYRAIFAEGRNSLRLVN